MSFDVLLIFVSLYCWTLLMMHFRTKCLTVSLISRFKLQHTFWTRDYSIFFAVNAISFQRTTDYSNCFVQSTPVKAALLFNQSAIHSLPVTVNLMTVSRLRSAVPSASINVSVWPWPEPELFDKRRYLGTLVMMALIGVALLFVVPTFATEIVRDRRVRFCCCRSFLIVDVIV